MLGDKGKHITQKQYVVACMYYSKEYFIKNVKMFSFCLFEIRNVIRIADTATLCM